MDRKTESGWVDLREALEQPLEIHSERMTRGGDIKNIGKHHKVAFEAIWRMHDPLVFV